MTLSSRVNAVVAYCCLFCAVAAATIGGLGIVGVRAATQSEKSLTADELKTALITSTFSHQIDTVYADAQAVLHFDDSRVRASSAVALRDHQVPAVESSFAALRRIHEGDAAAEAADVDRLGDQWVALRTVVNGSELATGHARTATALRAAYQPLTDHLAGLTDREARDAAEDQARTRSFVHRLMWSIVVGVLLIWGLFALLGTAAARRLRQAIEPAREQVEFAETLQLAENESEAHELLQRHLQRVVAGSTVTVLNRNNSADRLEAVTALPSGSPLVPGLAHAEPRSCLAVRSARVHEEDERRPGLLGCSVCSGCPGVSTCTPLNVGGEVIGSVLVNRAQSQAGRAPPGAGRRRPGRAGARQPPEPRDRRAPGRDRLAHRPPEQARRR